MSRLSSRNVFSPALALVAVAAFAGCDETGSTRTDAELIVGTWPTETVNVRVDLGPTTIPVPVLDVDPDEDEVSFTFTEGGAFTFEFDPDETEISFEAGEDTVAIPLPSRVEFSGTYEIDEADDRLTFSTVGQTTREDFVLAYDFDGEDGLELAAEDAETLALLLGLADADAAVLAQYVAGGSFSLERQD